MGISDIQFCDRCVRHLRQRACLRGVRDQQTPEDSNQLLRCFFGSVRYFGREHQYSSLDVHNERVSYRTLCVRGQKQLSYKVKIKYALALLIDFNHFIVPLGTCFLLRNRTDSFEYSCCCGFQQRKKLR